MENHDLIFRNNKLSGILQNAVFFKEQWTNSERTR